MESVLNYIEELQRIVDDLATSSGAIDKHRYEADCDMFLERIETFVNEKGLGNPEYIEAKLAEIRSGLSYLLKENTNSSRNLTRYQSHVVSGLNSIYRNIRSPVTAPGDDSLYDE